MNWQKIDNWVRPASMVTFLITSVITFLIALVWAATGILNIPYLGRFLEVWILFSIAYSIVSLVLDWQEQKKK